MQSMEIIKCINCGQAIENNFCSHCGQRSSVRRITFREGWNDFWARIYGFDGMFPRTLRDLTIRPGKVAELFIEGNRARYYGPVGYFFLMITLYLLILSLLDINLIDYTKTVTKYDFAPQLEKGSGKEEMIQTLFKFINDNIKIISFTLIPLQAIAAKYIFFRKEKYNFLEHMVLPFYVEGHLYWLKLVSVIYFSLSHNFILNAVIGIISFFYFPYSYTTLFTTQSKTVIAMKGIGVYLVGSFLYISIMITLIGIAILINPDWYELIKPSNNK
jgi:Protein of unknown function (DUF3667)